MAGGKRKKKPYVGDRILAGYLFLSCSLGNLILLLLTAAAFGVAFAPSWRKAVEEQFRSFDLNALHLANYSLAIAILCVFAISFSTWLIVATWRSRKWALWFTLLWGLPGAAASLTLGGEYWMGAIVPTAVTIYCMLRVSGSVGPKL